MLEPYPRVTPVGHAMTLERLAALSKPNPRSDVENLLFNNTDQTASIMACLGRGERVVSGLAKAAVLCARIALKRSGDRGDTTPGRYSGAVRVAGRSIAGVDVPVEITVKRDRRFALIVAMFAALAGAVAAGANSRPADVTAAEASKNKRVHDVLWFMPLLIGVIAGTVAGVLVYVDDPTWGANLTTDLGKLLGASLAAATGGLTALAPVSRGARRTIAQS